MRLSLFFKLKNNKIPLDYRAIFISFIKKSFQDNSEQMFEKYFPSDKPIIKNYTFSVFLGKCIFNEDSIILNNNKLILNFSFYDTEEMPNFANAFLKQLKKSFDMPLGNSMTLDYINLKEADEIKSETAIFRLQSPLVIKRHDRINKDYYFSYEEDGFLEQFKENLYFQVSELNLKISKEDIENIEFLPIDMKRVVVKNYDIYVQGSLGIFGMNAKKEILNYIYHAGLGSKKSSGMGYLKLLK